MIIEDIKNHIATGVDAKIMQYEENAVNISDDQIDLIEILGGKQNCILINMEKDVERYKTSIKQFEKVTIKNFVHLKGTDGRNKDKKYLENDLTYILEFLSQFNSDIKPKQIKINEFSETNDSGVGIQDGPLGCYCSHLRALIYAYLNFEDYVIICEDDISITNTEKIEKYIKQIPNDWDIICLNSRAKNISYGEASFYKFIDDFHSLHFYIVKIKALPTIFKNMYPMNDQVDVLMSDMVPLLNIYNIPDTVYQKNIKTNTQNNLHIIFNSPNYNPVKDSLERSEEMLLQFANKILSDNEERNKIIVKNLIYDVLYNYILIDDVHKRGDNIETYEFSNPYLNDPQFKTLTSEITFFIQCSRKGINVNESALSLANTLLFTLSKFDLHNTIDEDGNKLKAYSFGSSAHTYKVGELYIIKKYNQKLRWTTEGHDNPKEIFQKEVKMLEEVKTIKGCPTIKTSDDLTIKMIWNGESLYNNFDLPSDWQKQITDIFSELTSKGIFYPEFRLQNILVLNDIITFVDFGLAQFRNDCDNSENLKRFITYIQTFNDRFKSVQDLEERHRLISTFSINHRL